MRQGYTPRRARTDYPAGVLACYDNGGRSFDQYTVVYMPFAEIGDSNGGFWFQGVSMSAHPFEPQGFGQHFEQRTRPGVGMGKGYGNACGRVIRFEDLPEDCRKLVHQDLAEMREQEHEHARDPSAFAALGCPGCRNA